ncbi:hypothetical protein AAMO2058_001328300 [Amorphochlora amoebiformis]
MDGRKRCNPRATDSKLGITVKRNKLSNARSDYSLCEILSRQLLKSVIVFLGNRAAARLRPTCKLFDSLGKSLQQFPHFHGSLEDKKTFNSGTNPGQAMGFYATNKSRMAPNLVLAFLQEPSNFHDKNKDLNSLAQRFPHAEIMGCFSEGILGMSHTSAKEIETMDRVPKTALSYGYIPDSVFKSLTFTMEELLQGNISEKMAGACGGKGGIGWKGFLVISTRDCAEALNRLFDELHKTYPYAEVAGGLTTSECGVFGCNRGKSPTHLWSGCTVMCFGGRVKLDTFSVQHDARAVRRSLSKAKHTLSECGLRCACSVLFTCWMRGMQYHGKENVESKEAWKLLKPAPVNGIFAGGEIGPRSSRIRGLRGGPAKVSGFTAVFALISIDSELIQE